MTKLPQPGHSDSSLLGPWPGLLSLHLLSLCTRAVISPSPHCSSSRWPDACMPISCHSLGHAPLVGRAVESSSWLFLGLPPKAGGQWSQAHSLISMLCFCIKFPGHHPLKRYRLVLLFLRTSQVFSRTSYSTKEDLGRGKVKVLNPSWNSPPSVACDILVLQLGLQTHAFCTEEQSLNYWAVEQFCLGIF